MHKLYITLVLSILAALICCARFSGAISSNVLISQIKVGNSATSRLVEIYNNSDMPVDITDWCLFYSSPSNTSPYANLGCFETVSPAVHVFINARSYALLASTQTGLSADMVLTLGLGSGTSGHVYLMDGSGNEVDRVGWGTAVNAEANQSVMLDSTKVIERRQDVIPGVLIDTDNNKNDFFNSTLRAEYQYGALFEQTDLCINLSGIQQLVPDGYEVDDVGNCALPPVDLCINLEGLQTSVPDGYDLDEVGDCQADVCQNIDGLQLVIPSGMEIITLGECIFHDECPNLPDAQAVIPIGYKLGGDNTCLLDLLPIKITELLPNPDGSDDDNEFIEFFNPNDSEIDLANYIFYVGADNTKSYSFPIGSLIGPKQYLAFSNDGIKYTLVNTAGSARLSSIDGGLIDEASNYENAKDGMAWALIDDVWQYTNRPTPGNENLKLLIAEDPAIAMSENSLEPCAANQYRNPETNRCKLLPTANTLTPCKDGQYRSEETNRCRNIVSEVASLTQCPEGQERNPTTNRCRSIASVLGTSTLAPCKAGQERNPATNRCRNVTAATIAKADYAPEQTKQLSNNSVLWWSLAGVGVVAVGYGIWEWRQEIKRLWQKIGPAFNSKK